MARIPIEKGLTKSAFHVRTTRRAKDTSATFGTRLGFVHDGLTILQHICITNMHLPILILSSQYNLTPTTNHVFTFLTTHQPIPNNTSISITNNRISITNNRSIRTPNITNIPTKIVITTTLRTRTRKPTSPTQRLGRNHINFPKPNT